MWKKKIKLWWRRLEGGEGETISELYLLIKTERKEKEIVYITLIFRKYLVDGKHFGFFKIF